MTSCRAGEDTCNCLPSCDDEDYYEEADPIIDFEFKHPMGEAPKYVHCSLCLPNDPCKAHL